MKYVNFCLLVILSLALSSGSVKSDRPSVGYYPGEMMPDIALTDAQGMQLTLSELKGKQVVVNFWASYDAQSRATNVQLYNFLRESKADVAFLSVSFDENLNVLQRTLVLDQLNTDNCYRELEGRNSDLYNEFKFNKGFRSYLIDEEGVIAAIDIDPEQLRSILKV